MSKKTNESKKRANSLILLIAFTAILLVASTYAWFSTQKNVSINNLKGKVEVAEGLQISLDADNWDQEIDLENWEAYDTGIGTAAGASGDKSTSNYRPKDTDVTSATEKYTNKSIGFMEVMSTSGKTDNTTTYIPLSSGKYIGNKVKSLTRTSADEDNKGYYAFDIYLMNTSKIDSHTHDQLQLNFNSKVTKLGNEVSDYGLQNAVRVALGLFDKNTHTEEHDGLGTSKTKNEVVDTTNASDSKITQVAIWEPNYNMHSDYVRKQHKVLNKFLKENYSIDYGTQTNTKINTYAVKTDIVGGNTIHDAFTAGDKAAGSAVDTDCLEEYVANVTSGKYVSDYSTTDEKLGKWVDPSDDTHVKAGKSADTTEDETTTSKFKSTITDTTPVLNGAPVEANQTGVVDLVDVKGSAFKLEANSISRVRVYIWLEGQDPDCVNWASQSSGINVTLGLCKGSGVGSTTEDHDA